MRGSDEGSGSDARGRSFGTDRDRLAAIVRSSDDAIYSKDEYAVITSWNPAAERLYGYTADEVIGKPIAILVPPHRAGEDKQILYRILDGEHVEHFKTERLTKAGDVIPVSITVSPVHDADGRIVEASVVARDITHQHRADEALTKAREAEAANTAIREFVAMATHDLKTPLSVISTMTSLMKEAWHDLKEERRVEMLDVLERNARHMSRLVQDLLLISKVEAGELQPSKEVVRVREVLEEVLASFDEHIDLAGAPAELAAAVDRYHLQRILANLIANAQKHGAPPILVTAEANDDSVDVRVSDRGRGIPIEFVPRLFKKFSKGDLTSGRGTGLGLAIVHSLAESNGGGVRYEPNEPHGSCFIVSLPLAPAS